MLGLGLGLRLGLGLGLEVRFRVRVNPGCCGSFFERLEYCAEASELIGKLIIFIISADGLSCKAVLL